MTCEDLQNQVIFLITFGMKTPTLPLLFISIILAIASGWLFFKGLGSDATAWSTLIEAMQTPKEGAYLLKGLSEETRDFLFASIVLATAAIALGICFLRDWWDWRKEQEA